MSISYKLTYILILILKTVALYVYVGTRLNAIFKEVDDPLVFTIAVRPESLEF